MNQIENNNFKMVRDGVTVASHAYASALRQNIRCTVGQRFMSTTNEGTPDGFWLGDIMEVMIISRSLSNEEQLAINHYLAKKWNLTETVDSDGDGMVDAHDADPLDATKSYDVPDFSDTVDAQIGKASGLDSIEANMNLWLDASNINGAQNGGISDGDAIAEWKDLSGNGHDFTQSNATYIPTYDNANGDQVIFNTDFMSSNAGVLEDGFSFIAVINPTVFSGEKVFFDQYKGGQCQTYVHGVKGQPVGLFLWRHALC